MIVQVLNIVLWHSLRDSKMPAIRSQTVLTDGFEIETVEFGKRKVTFLELGGNAVQLTAYLDDIQVAQQTLNNPSLTDIYTWVANNLFPGASVSVDGKVITVNEEFYVAWHLIQRNPLALLLYCGDDPPPSNWWDNSGKPA